jgi:hypothetical protein
MVIASIRLLGKDAPPSSLAWLETLASASNETFALSYADSDITVALQSGATTVLEPTSFDFAINPSRFAEESSVEASPTTPDDTSGTTDPALPPPLPTTTSLTAWNYTLPAVAWPIAGSATSSDVSIIEESGYSTTILSSGNVKRSSQAVAAFTTRNGEILVSDDVASAQFNYALEAQTEPSWAGSLDRVASRIAAASSAGSPDSTMVIVADRGVLPNIDRLKASVAAIEDVPGVTLGGLSTVVTGPETSGQIVDQTNKAGRIDQVVPLFKAEAADGAFSTVAEDPALITGQRRLKLLATLAPQWNRHPGGWGSAITDFLAESVALHKSVRVIESSEITFAADRGLLPITVRNDLSQSVTVIITVRPRTPLLSIEDTQFELTIEPDSQRRALIPAESRSNGIVELVVSIRTLDGLSVGQTTTVTTRVQAGWETPVTVTIGVVVLLMFGFGLIRTIRRRRADRAAISA